MNISEVKRHLLSLAAGVTGYCGAVNISEIGTTFQDNIVSLLVLGGLFLIISSAQKSRIQPLSFSKKTVFASGFLFGCATGLKLTTAIYSIPFVLSLLLISSSWRDRITNTLLSSLSVCIGIIMTMGYWMMVLRKNFSNPLFPFFNKLFKSPYYETKNFIQDIFSPRDIYQKVFYPFYFIKSQTLVCELPFRDIRLSVCYILVVLLLFVIFNRWVNTKYGFIEISEDVISSNNQNNILVYIVVFFVTSYILWQCTFSIYRYIIPLELLSPAFIVLIIRYIFPFEKIFIRLSLATFALILATVSPPNWGRAAWEESYFYVRIPQTPSIANSIIIMADGEPLSYIIPYFPKGTRFVNINNNFLKSSSKNLLQDKIKKNPS